MSHVLSRSGRTLQPLFRFFDRLNGIQKQTEFKVEASAALYFSDIIFHHVK